MLTTDNYFTSIKHLNIADLPEALQEGHNLIAQATKNGSSWKSYHSSATFREMVDLHFQQMEKFVREEESEQPDIREKEKLSNDFLKARAFVKKLLKPFVDRSENVSMLPNGKLTGSDTRNIALHNKPEDAIFVTKLAGKVMMEVFSTQGLYDEVVRDSQKPSKKSSSKQVTTVATANLVARIPDELRLMSRFVNLHGKVKTKEQLLTLINALQKAIVEKRIRKTSPWAAQITYMQDKLLETYNEMKGSKTIQLKSETLSQFKEMVGGEMLLPSVGFIKRYISLHQKEGIKEKAKMLLSSMDKALSSGRVTDNDPYALELQSVKTNLQNFVGDKKMKVLDIEPATLRGLQGVLSGLGCACQSLNGTGDLPAVMNSLDFVKLEFPTIGFTGKWRDFIGNPSPGFTVMVFGLPKFGKSTLCIDFAGYLAEQHGRVLYVAKEERLHRTLQDKVIAMGVSHARLDVASMLPDNLAPYDYIFLDSVNLLGLSVEQLRQLKARYSGKSFVFVFQSTKAGKFRGENAFQHDVDSVVEVPEWGKARQYGRYNQGGEMDIFEGEEFKKAA